MARVARERHGVTVTTAGFDDVPGAGPFAGVWAHFSLLHAPREDLPRHLAAIRAELAPGGRLVLGMKLGTGERRDRLGRRYTYYSEAELREALVAADLVPGAAQTGESRGLAGDLDPWIVLHARA